MGKFTVEIFTDGDAFAGEYPGNSEEVARILEPSVATFLPGVDVPIVERRVSGWDLRYGHYEVDGASVWGATARVLSQLGAVLGG